MQLFMCLLLNSPKTYSFGGRNMGIRKPARLYYISRVGWDPKLCFRNVFQSSPLTVVDSRQSCMEWGPCRWLSCPFPLQRQGLGGHDFLQCTPPPHPDIPSIDQLNTWLWSLQRQCRHDSIPLPSFWFFSTDPCTWISTHRNVNSFSDESSYIWKLLPSSTV